MTRSVNLNYNESYAKKVPFNMRKYSQEESVLMSVSMSDEPQTYEEAIDKNMRSQSEIDEWNKGMQEEINSLIDRNVFTLVYLPESTTHNIIGNKFVYKKKINSLGEVIRYKARLCAKGYSQVEGQDYHEIYAAVVKYKSIRLILILICIWDYEYIQMDVKTAFL